MARIRTIKPELPQSETIGALSREARLLFVLLFTIADDAGRARAASRLLASLLYPYDADAADLIDGWLEELQAKNCVRRYEVDGSQYLEIVKWLEHQKIDRPSASRLPAFVEGSTQPREDSRSSDADLGPSTLESGSRTVADASVFEEFWKAYPRRDSDEQRDRTQEAFGALVKTGVDPKVITFGAMAYCAKVRKQNNYATRYVKVAWRWLAEQDFSAGIMATLDVEAEPEVAEKDWRSAVKRWLLNESNWPRWAGNSPGSRSCRCPPEILADLGVCPNTARKIDDTWHFAEIETPELAANIRFAEEHRLPVRIYKITIDGVEREGAWFMKRIPPGYDEATGEKLAPSSDEAAA